MPAYLLAMVPINLQILLATSHVSSVPPGAVSDSIHDFLNLKSTKEKRILLLDFQWFQQNSVNKILRTYQQIRDLNRSHGNFDRFVTHAPFFFLLNIIAVAFNSTLVVPSGLRDTCNGTKRTVSIIDYITSTQSILNFISQRHNKSIKGVLFNLPEDTLNFAYCQHRKKSEHDASPLGIFKSTAESVVWLCLGFSIIFTGISMKMEFSRDFSLIILTTLSVLLSPGTSGFRSTSKLFVLWMFASLIFVTYYSGSLTSVVTRPSPDLRFVNVEELQANNYSFILTGPLIRNLLKEKIQGLSSRLTVNQNESGEIKKLFQTSFLFRSYNRTWHDWLLGSRRFASFGYSQVSLNVANLVKESLTGKDVNRIRCYVGQQVELTESAYFLVSSPEIKRLGGIIESFVEAGLVHFLMKEFLEIFAYNRVQDRSRSISLTKVVEDVETPKPLNATDGKVASVFILLGFTLGISLVMFVLEAIGS